MERKKFKVEYFRWSPSPTVAANQQNSIRDVFHLSVLSQIFAISEAFQQARHNNGAYKQ